MADIPHFKPPFQITAGRVATLEQDSDEDILTCVETILRTPAGSRDEEPEYGVNDLPFHNDPNQIEEECRAAITEWEPRANAIPDTEITNQIANTQIGVTNG